MDIFNAFVKVMNGDYPNANDPEERRQWAESAEDGNPFARTYCKLHNIPFTDYVEKARELHRQDQAAKQQRLMNEYGERARKDTEAFFKGLQQNEEDQQ